MTSKAVSTTEKKFETYIYIVVFIILFCVEVTFNQFLGLMPYFVFLGGVLTASYLSLQTKITKKTLSSLGIPLLIAFVAFLPGKHENHYGEHLDFHAALAIGFYLILFPLALRKQLLPSVNGQIVFFFTILFWYLLSSNYANLKDYFPWYILLLMAAGTLTSGLFAVMGERNTAPGWRLFIYLWYLIILILISLIQVSHMDISMLVDAFATKRYSAWEMFLDGVSIAFLVINIGVVFGSLLEMTTAFSFLPVTRNRDQLRRGLQEGVGKIEKEAGFLESRYLDQYLPLGQLFFLYVVQGTTFLVNDRYHFMPQFLLSALMVSLASLTIALIHLLNKFRERG